MKKYKQSAIRRRITRIRSKVRGTKTKPRLTVFRSNQYTYAQLIDDEKGVTLAAASEKELAPNQKTKSGKKQPEATRKSQKLTKMERAGLVGELLAKKAKKKGISQVAFDRGAYRYHGRVKKVAEAARSQGLEF